ncbi:MAG: NAD(P)/FAD-dependent oxidoreductase [Pseudomonadota bacterium]
MLDADVIVIGAGAAGLMCAATAGARGRRVLLLEHNDQPGKKILISGGGRCNFTNIYNAPEHFLSHNPHFCKSALARYTQWDFIAKVAERGIAYHEKTLGQQFCDDSAQQIVDMLVDDCSATGVTLRCGVGVSGVTRRDRCFAVQTDSGEYRAESVVVACGGRSFPRLGASDLGYRIAESFDLPLTAQRAALVPFTFDRQQRTVYEDLAGVSLDVQVECSGQHFREAMLFTHKGLSGPAMLQISSYWQPGDTLAIDLMPEGDFAAWLAEQRQQHGQRLVTTALKTILPRRLAEHIANDCSLAESNLAQLNKQQNESLAARIQPWEVTPAGDEGYRKAEVTLGGVDTRALSSKTMEARGINGLYFIGEVVDVTGHLGGHNFQWAWASGHCAGSYA